MPDYTQANRPLRVKTALGGDKLMLAGFTGQEAVSRPFSYHIELASTDNAIKGDDLLRTPMTITVMLRGGGTRFINGTVRRFVQGGTTEDLTFYRAEIVPWLWFLSLARDCRIFQKLNVLDIIEKVFKGQGYSDYEIRCSRSYPEREYCVQYRETNLNFVSRLMEEEGIFYFFEHTDSKHVLVLADANNSFKPCPGGATARMASRMVLDEDVLTEVHSEHAVFIGQVTLQDYDFVQPALTLKSSISGDGVEEVYDYVPVQYTTIEDGEKYARIRLEAEEAVHQVIAGEGTCRFLQAGCKFDLKEHDRDDLNQTYLLLSVKQGGGGTDYRTWQSDQPDFEVEFEAIPASAPYRPPHDARKPVVHGTQSAVVVGKAGEEIWVDKHGRVKVQFHWDREGSKDENSSCWVRVSSLWAGKQWGAIHIPRIGQEVLVDFIEGDPDRPIITGRVYNAEQAPPYALPDNQTQSGVKSRSSKGGGADNFNEIRFEDKKGEELFYIQAEKDKQVLVKNDRNEEVKKNETILIGENRTEEVKKNEQITIGENRTEEVKKDEKITIGGSRTEEVGKDETVHVKGKREVTVDGNEKLTAGANQDVDVKSNRAVTVGAGDKLEVGTNLDMKVNQNINIKSSGGKLVAEAPLGIELKVGACTVKVTPAGIEMKAPQIKIEGMAQVEVKAPIVNGKADAMLQLKGAIAQVNGDGVLMLKGAITMIN
jgi:type VI secretion system secreted protein VgrG